MGNKREGKCEGKGDKVDERGVEMEAKIEGRGQGEEKYRGM